MKLKLQYFGHLTRRADSLEKTLMLGKIEGRRSRRQRTRWLDGIPDSMYMSLSKLLEMVKDQVAWRTASVGSQRVGHNWVTEQQLFSVCPNTFFGSFYEHQCLVGCVCLRMHTVMGIFLAQEYSG